MSFIAESAAQKGRLAGAKAMIRARGRELSLSSENNEDNDQKRPALIDDMPMMSDSERPAQARNPVYVFISCLAGSFSDPTSVTQFTEVRTGKPHKVLEYLETSGDRIWWKWRCESQREGFGQTEDE